MQTSLPPPPLSETPIALAFEAGHTPTSTLTTPSHAAALHAPSGACHAPLQRVHLQRLQLVQAVCENETGESSFLTIADVQLALYGLERYFAPLFQRYRLSLPEVQETLLWAAGAFPNATLVLDDIIHVLVTRIVEEQFASRRQAKRGGA